MKRKKNGNHYNNGFRKINVSSYHFSQKVKELSVNMVFLKLQFIHGLKKFTPLDFDNGSSVTPDDYTKTQWEMKYR